MISCKGIADHVKGSSSFMDYTYYISRGLYEKSSIVFKPKANGLYSPVVGVTGISLIYGLGQLKRLE